MRTVRIGRSVILLSLTLVLGAATAGAKSDPAINDWGSPPGTPPPWQTADVWVDNNGSIPNEPGEPSRGIVNLLSARIRNLGPTPVSGVTVRFAYAPYGLWAPASHADFKEFAVVNGVAIGPAPAAVIVGTEWDLTDLTENNGGAWGGFTVGDFDHFCVLVTITADDDANPANNVAQNNFANVPIVAGLTQSIKFLIANPKRQENAAAELVLDGVPEDWRFELAGIERGRTLLKPREVRLVTLTFTPPKGDPDKPPSARVNVALRLDGKIVGGLSFDAKERQTAALFPPAGGQLSPYLIGTYDLRSGLRTTFQVVNPTGSPLRVMVAFFDADEKALACVRDRLSPNDLLEIDARRHVRAPTGVVKIVSFQEDGDRPVAGVVGYQRTFARTIFRGYRLRAETVLHAIPAEILAGDMAMIRRACP